MALNSFEEIRAAALLAAATLHGGSNAHSAADVIGDAAIFERWITSGITPRPPVSTEKTT